MLGSRAAANRAGTVNGPIAATSKSRPFKAGCDRIPAATASTSVTVERKWISNHISAGHHGHVKIHELAEERLIAARDHRLHQQQLALFYHGPDAPTTIASQSRSAAAARQPLVQ